MAHAGKEVIFRPVQLLNLLFLPLGEGLNELILREDISAEVAENARNIQGASKLLLTLINDILDISKVDCLAFTPDGKGDGALAGILHRVVQQVD